MKKLCLILLFCLVPYWAIAEMPVYNNEVRQGTSPWVVEQSGSVSISGSVAVKDVSGAMATSANQTSGSQKSQSVDSSGNNVAGKFYDVNTGTYRGLEFWANAPQLLTQPYLFAIGEGDITGHNLFVKYGVNAAVSNTTTDIWEVGGTYAFPTTAVVLDVSSTSATDSSASTGVNAIRIECLDASYNTQYVDASVNGTATFTTSQLCLRINKAWVTGVGTSGMAAGNIDIRDNSTRAVLARIAVGRSQSRQLIYTVPLGKTLYIVAVHYSCGVGNTTASGKFNYITLTNRATVNPQTGAKATIFYPFNEIGLVNQAFVLPLEVPTKIPATADLKITALGDTALAVTCTAAIRGWLE